MISTHPQPAGGVVSFWSLAKRSNLVMEEDGPHLLEQSNFRSACSAS